MEKNVCIYQCFFVCFFSESQCHICPRTHLHRSLTAQNSKLKGETGGREGGGNAQRTIFRAKKTFNSSPLAKPPPLPPPKSRRSRFFKKKKKKKKIQGEPQFQFLILMTVREVSEREDVTGLTEGFSFFLFLRGPNLLFCGAACCCEPAPFCYPAGGTQTAHPSISLSGAKGNDTRRDLSLNLGEPCHHIPRLVPSFSPNHVCNKWS